MRHPTANASQRARRTQAKRIDYYPGPEALELIRGHMGDRYPLSIWSGAIDAIVLAWAEQAGIKYCPEIAPTTPAKSPEFSDPYARANDFGRPENRTKQRVACGGRRRRDGQPCQALSVPGKRRCKWHGGCSTGPRTVEGQARALANLRRGSTNPPNLNRIMQRPSPRYAIA